MLGELEVADGDLRPIEVPQGSQSRLLVGLAINPGTPRPTAELGAITFGDSWASEYGQNLQVPAARLRRIGFPVDRFDARTNSYRALLRRDEVDVTWFIDRMQSGPLLDVTELDQVLEIWRGNPIELYSFIPPHRWLPLARARDSLIAQIPTLVTKPGFNLARLEAFCEVFPSETAMVKGNAQIMCPPASIFIVDDEKELTDELQVMLGDYECVVANSAAEAMTVIKSGRVSGCALIDLNLSRAGNDEAGYSILRSLRVRYPNVPRALFTSTPPAGGVTSLLREYDLFDVIVKRDAAAPAQTRDIVDAMLGTSPQSIHRRAELEFKSLSHALDDRLRRRVIAANRANAAQENLVEIGPLIDKMDELDQDIARTSRRISESEQHEDIVRVLLDFKQRWTLPEENP
jgi:CheY-like chemotaxis protein